MTGRRNTIIAISAIVVFAAVVGFFITLDVSPQIAYARLFIDAGLVIGLIAVVMAFYREKELPLDSIVSALKSLKDGKYKTRISLDSQNPLSEISAGVNDLAIALEEHQFKQEEIKRNLREELLPTFNKQKEPVNIEHSHHPELGPVHALGNILKGLSKEPSLNARDTILEPILTRPPTVCEQRLSNTLIESNPPQEGPVPKFDDLHANLRPHQDLGELYQRFVDAQRAINMDQIEYTLFLKTIEKTTDELKASYKCQGVFFDIANEAGVVALQPKIVR